MKRIQELLRKREEIGRKPSYKKGGNHNDLVEYTRLGELILEEIEELHKTGKLKNIVLLPFEIGEKVYVIKNGCITEDYVKDYDIWSLKNGIHLRIELQNVYDYVVGEFGKNVFATKKEAEQALARMEKENG